MAWEGLGVLSALNPSRILVDPFHKEPCIPQIRDIGRSAGIQRFSLGLRTARSAGLITLTLTVQRAQ